MLSGRHPTSEVLPASALMSQVPQGLDVGLDRCLPVGTSKPLHKETCRR